MSYYPSDAPPQGPPHIHVDSSPSYNPFNDSNEVSPGGHAQSPVSPVSRSLTPPVGFNHGNYAYGSANTPTESSDYLVPPQAALPSRDDYNFAQSPDQSAFSSRRTSWSSDVGVSENRPFVHNPFDDSRAVSRAGSDDEDLNTQTVSQKYNIVPTDGLILFPEDVEKDDDLHNPDLLQEKDRACDLFNLRGFNLLFLIVFSLGLLMVFIGWPILVFVKPEETSDTNESNCDPGDTLCLDVGPRPLLKNIRTGLIDPDTPESAKTKVAVDGKTWNLVFSDEFNTDGRTFYDEDDPFFQAVDLWYGVTQDLEWYDPDAITTKDGKLQIRFDAFVNHDLDYRSGMLQSWNKLCFSGGRLEASISLPGKGDVSGFWPGFWAMGNLGRPGYAATTEGLWPYSYHDECDPGITANQSQTDGINWLPGMRLPACTCKNEDHPNPGKSRSAPEIDVIEASVGALNNNDDAVIGIVSQSLQIAPYDIFYMPDLDFAAVYNDKITHVNEWRGGPYQQSMSGLSNLNNDWYDGKAYQIYAFEYEPGPQGAVTWFVGEDKTWTLDARAVRPNGNVGQRVIPVEPMSIIMNLGMGQSFAPINKTIHELMPAYMRFDYIRIYQDPDNDNHTVTCDPPGRETTEYIKKHETAYTNINVTSWADAGYDWPKNSLVHGCS